MQVSQWLLVVFKVMGIVHPSTALPFHAIVMPYVYIYIYMALLFSTWYMLCNKKCCATGFSCAYSASCSS